MVRVVVYTFHHDYLKKDGLTEVKRTFDCYDSGQIVSALTYARWQFERFGNHSNVDLFYNCSWYYGAI